MVSVSIITPVYNVERCIEKTINSIINQSCKNFELLLIDDGSNDKSIEIAENLLINSDVDFKVIRQENSGVSVARNKGISEAKGEYVCFLDSDDYIHTDYIKLMYEKASNCNCDLVFCDYTQVDSQDKVLVKSTTRFLDDFINGREAALKQLSCDITIGMGSALYKTSIIKENNILFDSSRKYAEDVVFTIKALLNMDKIISIDKTLMFYVRWNSSVTNLVSLKHLDCYYSYVDLLKYLNSQEDFKNIEKFLIEYKIPYAISHIFSILCRDKKFHKDLFEFLNKREVKESLGCYKMQKFNKNDIRYLIQCKGILYFPNILLKVFSKRK
ncbi:glycosyl transferase [Clostridium gelidum]|uniref:Glycosyl transferase n=1 Tax=Clostridium gelidum TaxID=704125 RepID=A0ABN6J3M0_9CLOT|nr:glycosyltransferase family 2 protein [Clostridium gelidum]BCZ48930.1 glycosyl transferase [Clostridium gelidum]